MSLEKIDKQTVINENFDLNLVRPTISIANNENVSVATRKCKYKKDSDSDIWKNDGLCPSLKNSPVYSILGYSNQQSRELNILEKSRSFSKLLEIIFREVELKKINQSDSEGVLKITSIAILLENTVICKTKCPFNRKIHKLLLHNKSLNYNELLIKVSAQGGTHSTLPLHVPRIDEKTKNIELQFGINDKFGNVFSGTIVYSISSSHQEQPSEVDQVSYIYPTLNDPNDPNHDIFYFRPFYQSQKNVSFFSLEHSALELEETLKGEKIKKRDPSKSSKVSVSERNLTMLGVRGMVQRKGSLELPEMTRSYANKKPVLSIIILRGVEVPVREESAMVQPLVEIQWGDSLRSTSPAEGSAPVWHETLQFPIQKIYEQQSIIIRLFDQHPVWGLQWLGECIVPIECYGEYEEFERWISLSPFQSPLLTLGYVQASPEHSFTRISVLMKMENMNVSDEVDLKSIDKLSTKIQRCLAVPHKIPEMEDPKDILQLTMLLSSLSIHQGPLTPRQALNLGQVDYYGRVALLTSLLQGLDQQAYVILGSSQTRKWAAFTLTVNEDNEETIIWDPENGDSCELRESRNPLIKCFRLINHQNVWENTQTIMSPVDLKYNPKVNKDWRPLSVNVHFEDRPVQILELCNTHVAQLSNFSAQTEQELKEKLCQLRKKFGAPTVFNRHASLILQDFLAKVNTESSEKLDRSELKQLYRAYYTHGFILKIRNMNSIDLCKLLVASKIHLSPGSVEFGLKCHMQHHIGNIYSIWLALVVLKSRK